jgi:hypothetical protein
MSVSHRTTNLIKTPTLASGGKPLHAAVVFRRSRSLAPIQKTFSDGQGAVSPRGRSVFGSGGSGAAVFGVIPEVADDLPYRDLHPH